MRKPHYLAIALLLCLGEAWAFQVESLALHVELASLSQARPPFVHEENLVLSAKGPWRSVGASFEFEHFTQVHAFQRNAQGVFLLVLPIPLETRAPLAYRLILDGVWTSDPANPLRAPARGSVGAELSLAEVPFLSSERPGIWKILQDDGRTVRFRWRGPSGEFVTVAGDFNNWDPFLNELEETAPGLYELSLRLAPGAHFYTFVNRGRVFTDPLNPSVVATMEGKMVSTIVTGGAPPPRILSRAEVAKAAAAANAGK
jgi:hypothetical protein